MTCHNCHIEMVKAGFYGKNRIQRFKCKKCGRRLSEPQQKPFGADVRLPREKVQMILHCLVEGNSIRGTARLCDVEKRTVLNLLVRAGETCKQALEMKLANVHVKDLELDEIWTFFRKKQRRFIPTEGRQVGDAYTFIALERTSKLVVAWHLGKRNGSNTDEVIEKIRKATAPTRFDVSTDAFPTYDSAIQWALFDRANHSQVVKIFENRQENRESYSPPKFVCVQKDTISGSPDLNRASTSHVERKNGTLRQWCRRLTRLTYAFSKKWENLEAALALHFWFYNFCRVHGTLRVTPAMEAGIVDHVWTLSELIA